MMRDHMKGYTFELPGMFLSTEVEELCLIGSPKFSPIPFAQDSSRHLPPGDDGCVGAPGGRGIGWPIPGGTGTC